jgi:hypothetical protein
MGSHQWIVSSDTLVIFEDLSTRIEALAKLFFLDDKSLPVDDEV